MVRVVIYQYLVKVLIAQGHNVEVVIAGPKYSEAKILNGCIAWRCAEGFLEFSMPVICVPYTQTVLVEQRIYY